MDKDDLNVISENDGNPTNGNHNGDDKHEKERRKRRSKNDPSGRQHKCEICGKTYLSRPALSQHIKTKHQDRIGEYKRGRGRPRKNNEDQIANINNNKYNDFFSKPNSKKRDDEESFKYYEALRANIKELYSNYQKVLNPEAVDIEKEHGLMKVEIKPENDHKDPKFVFYDESILRYLSEAASKVNRQYFDFMCKFCILFRESFNRQKRKENNLTEDYSSNHNAEEVPDRCNDFISEFMEQNNYFELDSNEVIDIIQHFCHWLYDKSFTTSVLSLM
jgi:hypothetical protein